MSKLYETWGKHKAKYQSLINTKVGEEVINLLAKVVLNDKKTTVTGKIKLNQDKGNGPLTGQPDVAISHTLSPGHVYILTQSGTKTTISGDVPLCQHQKHSFGLMGTINGDMDEKEGSCAMTALLKYDYNNSTNFMAGIESYDHSKCKLPNLLAMHWAYGRKMENGVNVYGVIMNGYLLKEKHCQYQRLLLAGRNSFFDFLLEFNSEKAQEQVRELGKSDGVNYNKTLGMSISTNLSPSLTVGGDSEFKVNKNSLTTRLFTNFQLNKDTLLKSKWEDSDKSVSLSLNHCYRGLLNLGLFGKFNMVKNENTAFKCPLPKIKTKLGLSIELVDSLI